MAGVGGGGIGTVAQIIVSDVVSLRQRGKYQEILGASVALANGVEPLIGGALASTSTDGWWVSVIVLKLSSPDAFDILYASEAGGGPCHGVIEA
ncbi:major facilitator superfamily transporter [Ceratobasidium sp. AG-Ba]|nr:major facilitator superfamily transporter [Ceratobasidium sp. AG-Ba]QRV99647.1 major facilitator superfamily transporter [Ceratobasidium sp. AG-Ba]QRW14181.1 major facilitator superfamily transporter [Ceratobasidium sp. AG-Ba]